MIFRSLILGIDKIPSKDQNIGSLINPQAFNSLSKCEAAMLKVRYQGANGTQPGRIRDKPKECLKAHWLESHKIAS